MMFKRVQKGVFPFFGPGQALYHPVYVENFVDSFECAMEKPESKGQTYLIADEHYYPIKEIVLKIANVMGVDLKVRHYPFWALYMLSAAVELIYKPLPADPPLFRRRADWFRQNRAFKIDKAKRELGYTPKIELDEGLAITYKWYTENGYL
jgi:nucleoside-diphosphate-sugar epimerase